MVHSILSNIDETKIHRDPFPYAVIENALPQEYYQALEASFPPSTFVAGGTELANNEVYRQSARDTGAYRNLARVYPLSLLAGVLSGVC